MTKRRFELWLAAIVCLLLGVLLGFGLLDGWRHGALWSGVCALTVIAVFFAMLMFESDNWRSELSMCLALSALPAIGVVWGSGLLFPFATLVGGVVLAVGFVGCMAHQQFMTAAGAALLCVMGALVMTIITLVSKFEPNVQAASTLMLASMLLFGIAVRESREEWRLAVGFGTMLSSFPAGTLLWSVGLPTLVVMIVGAAMFLAGIFWLVGHATRIGERI